jgi:hypothetical protein
MQPYLCDGALGLRNPKVSANLLSCEIDDLAMSRYRGALPVLGVEIDDVIGALA